MTQKEDIQNAVNVMRKGGVILYPTDTVWGIGCDATNAEAVAKVYKIKQRDDSKALICLTDSVDRVQRYVRDVPQHRSARHQRAVLKGALLPLPEGYREHKRQYQRRTDGTELPRHCAGDTGGCRLCVLDSSPGTQTAHTEQHYQAH